MPMLHARPVVPLQVGVIGRRTELVAIPSGHGRMRTISPHELWTGEIQPHLSGIPCGLRHFGAECVPGEARGMGRFLCSSPGQCV